MPTFHRISPGKQHAFEAGASWQIDELSRGQLEWRAWNVNYGRRKMWVNDQLRGNSWNTSHSSSAAAPDGELLGTPSAAADVAHSWCRRRDSDVATTRVRRRTRDKRVPGSRRIPDTVRTPLVSHPSPPIDTDRNTNQANSASYPRGTGNEYWPKGCEALRLESKGKYGSYHLWINVWETGKTVWSLVNTWAP